MHPFAAALTALAASMAFAPFVATRAAAAATPRGSFAYLHVEANEGGSSGGHVAIRFGDDVYHFQHHAGGIVRLHRDDAAVFRHRYARLENRALHVREIAARPETVARLQRRFDERLLREEHEDAQIAALEADHALLAALAAGETPHVDVRGAAFFASPDAAADVDTTSDVAQDVAPAVVSSRAAVDAVLAELRARDPALAILTQRGGEVDAARARVLASDAGPGLTRTLSELLAAERALDVLRDAPPLAPHAVRDADATDLVLDAAELAALARLRDQLAARGAALLASRRPDWGSALLLTIARLAVVERSLATRRLVVLDAFPADAAVLTPDEVAAERDLLPALLREAAADLARARRPLADGVAPRELQYTALETATNRYVELRAAADEGASLRVARGTLLPEGTATLPLVHTATPTARVDRNAWRAAAADAELRLAAARDARRDRRGYELLTRNCVSEIFREIAAALAPEPSASAVSLDCAGSRAELGGCIDPSAALRFIPFVSAAAVDEEYAVVAREEIPSHRAAALAAMRAHEPEIAVLLRESNVLTSTVYRPNAEDSVFLFFTDGAAPVRPLLGGANLATALGAAAAGLVLLPADDGTLLLRGLRGALFSLPELVFVSIRKGSFAWLPREDASSSSASTSAEPSTPSPESSSAAHVAVANDEGPRV